MRSQSETFCFRLTVSSAAACTCVHCLQMTIQLKTAEDNNTSLQQALKSEIELRMQLEGTVCVIVCLSICVKR